MRQDIVHPGAGQLHYEIRGIVELAQKLEATGLKVIWEISATLWPRVNRFPDGSVA